MSTESVAEKVTDKVLDKTELLITKAAETATSLYDATANVIDKAVKNYGSQVIDALLMVVRIDAIQSLMRGFVFLIITIALCFIAKTITLKIKEIKDSEQRKDTEGYSIMRAAVYFISLISLTISLIILCDVWHYVAIIKPELYLVKQAVDLTKEKLEKTVNKM